MAGEVDNGLDQDKQNAAAPKVEESIDAVQTTRQGTDAQGAAQTQAAWGNENGPQFFRDRVINMFSQASEFLSAENDLIRDFEVAVNQATEDALAAENDATVALTAVTERLDALDRSEASIKLADKMSKMGFISTRLAYDQATGETTEYRFVNGEWKPQAQQTADAAEAAQNTPVSGRPSDF